MAHVRRHPVRERRRHRAHILPRLALIPRDHEAGIRAAHDVVAVLRIDPDRVLVLAHVEEAARVVEEQERLTAVERLRHVHAGDVDVLFVARIDADLAEVERPSVAVADDRPRLALVVGSENARTIGVDRGWCAIRAVRAGTTAPTSPAAESAARAGVITPVIATGPTPARRSSTRSC